MGFRISIPSGFKVSMVAGTDFLVYSVSNGHQTVLGFYVGNFARFPPTGEVPLQTAVGDMPGRCVAHVDQAGASSRECLVSLARAFPSQIHFWYERLAQPERHVADGILDTLTPTESP